MPVLRAPVELVNMKRFKKELKMNIQVNFEELLNCTMSYLNSMCQKLDQGMELVSGFKVEQIENLNEGLCTVYNSDEKTFTVQLDQTESVLN